MIEIDWRAISWFCAGAFCAETRLRMQIVLFIGGAIAYAFSKYKERHAVSA
jgi:hypothetical protein